MVSRISGAITFAFRRVFLNYVMPMLLLSFAASVSNPDDQIGLSREMIGGVFAYEVRPGDDLLDIRSRFATSLATLVRENRIEDPDRIYPGEILRIDNQHIVPPSLVDGILINIPEKMLFAFINRSLVLAAPVAVGMPTWPTPIGPFTVLEKQTDPAWIVPPSIQEEMAHLGKKVLARVPPGPDNPLGRFWLGLSLPNYGIHGTNAPSSVYSASTHGCIRLRPGAISVLYKNVRIGSQGQIIYRPMLIYRSPNGHLYLEVHRDVYHRETNFEKIFSRWLTRHPEIKTDSKMVRTVLLMAEGRPVDISPGPFLERTGFTH